MTDALRLGIALAEPWAAELFVNVSVDGFAGHGVAWFDPQQLRDLAAQLGVSEADVVARAMANANRVLNTEDEDLGGTIAPAQLAHIARHKPYLRKQFRQG